MSCNSTESEADFLGAISIGREFSGLLLKAEPGRVADLAGRVHVSERGVGLEADEVEVLDPGVFMRICFSLSLTQTPRRSHA